MQKLWKADLTFTSRFRKNRRTLFMHSPLEIARNYIEVGIHKVNLSIFKTILLGFFAGMFIGFAGIASTTASHRWQSWWALRYSRQVWLWYL